MTDLKGGSLRVQSSCLFCSRCVQTVRKSDYLLFFHKPLMCTLDNILFLLLTIYISAACAIDVSPFKYREKSLFLPSPSQVSCVHSECILGDKMNFIQSDPSRLLSTESSKPQSPSKRLSVSRGIKQLFQSATKFVRFLQR